MNAPVLFVGSISGKFEEAFEDLAKLASKNTKIYLCGDVFGQNLQKSDYLYGDKKVPMPTLVLGPTCQKEGEFYGCRKEVREIIPNVTYMGKYGVAPHPGGCLVAYLGGVEGPDSTLWSFNEKEVKDFVGLCLGYPRIDVLVTYQWPKIEGIECDPGDNSQFVTCSKLIGQLVATIKPRMHVAASEQRPFTSPYMVHNDEFESKTIFHGLTSYEKDKEGKWVYGINLPLDRRAVPSNQTVPLPFSKFPDKFMKLYISDPSQTLNGLRLISDRRRIMNVVSPGRGCWYCVGNADIQESLVVAVGQDAYMALAKDPIVNGHVNILPISHVDKLAGAPRSVESNIVQYLDSLLQYFGSKGKQLIWFETRFNCPHMVINALPVDQVLLTDKILHALILEKCAEHELKVTVIKRPRVHNFKPGTQYFSTQYFYLQVGMTKGYLINIPTGSKFHENFGRTLVCHLLNNTPDSNWRHCIRDPKTVRRTVQNFTEEFKPYDNHREV